MRWVINNILTPNNIVEYTAKVIYYNCLSLVVSLVSSISTGKDIGRVSVSSLSMYLY